MKKAPPRRRRLKRGADAAGLGKSEPRKAGEFISLSLVDVVTAWEVVHPRGYRVRIKGQIDAAALGCILVVLDERLHG